VEQSDARAQCFGGAQAGQLPPQSTSLSVPFCTPSVHEGGAHTVAVQTPLAQSPAIAHAFVSEHGGQVPPPQSTSVSAPFFTMSWQLGAWQMPPVHAPWMQSVPVVHVLPSGQAWGQPPPQSTPASIPFFTPSLQVGIEQVLPMQTRLWQSSAFVQVPPTGHGQPGLQSLGLHASGTHVIAMQTPLLQSASAAHARMSPHEGQLPPQSTSVSLPFFTPSIQLGAVQVAPAQ
jgi:hypothetical protein